MKSIQKNESLVIEIKGVGVKKLVRPVDTLADASKLVSDYISFNDLGASKFKSAIIFHPTNGAFAHVSYNGRIWEGIDIYSFTRKEIIFN